MTRLRRFVAYTLIVLALAVIVRAIGLSTLEAANDELFHFLAAKNFLEDGSLSIGGAGEYLRGAWYTYVAAFSMELLGPELWAARLPSVVAGSLLALITFTWLWHLGEPLAAVLAGGLVALDPLLIELSQMARLYSFQHVVFLIGCIGVFTAVKGKLSPVVRGVGAFVAIVALWAASRLQTVSLIGVGGIVLFLLIILGTRRWQLPRHRRLTAVVGAIVVGVVAGGWLLASQPGVQDWILNLAPISAPNVAHVGGPPYYYYAVLLDDYAPLWALFPVLLLLAATRKPMLTLFCAVVLGSAFLVHSVHPWKAERYLSYLYPLGFIGGAVGVVEGFQRLLMLTERLVSEWISRISFRRVLTSGIVGLVVIFASVGNLALRETQALVTRDHSYTFPLAGAGDGPISWKRAANALEPYLRAANVVVSTEHVKALHYMGGVDYVLRPSVLDVNDMSRDEFWIDPRFGRPVISTRNSLEHIVLCYETGIFVAERMKWNQPMQLPSTVTSFLGDSLALVALPEQWGVVAYRWTSRFGAEDGVGAAARGDACRELPVME